MWITGCVGIKCPVAVASLMTQEDWIEQDCRDVIEVWRGISDKHSAVCVYGDYDKLNLIIEQTENVLVGIGDGW